MMDMMVCGCRLSVPQSRCITYSYNPHLTTSHNQSYVPYAVNICIVSSSWWWTWWCPKHVERIKSPINRCVASSWFLSSYHYGKRYQHWQTWRRHDHLIRCSQSNCFGSTLHATMNQTHEAFYQPCNDLIYCKYFTNILTDCSRSNSHLGSINVCYNCLLQKNCSMTCYTRCDSKMVTT